MLVLTRKSKEGIWIGDDIHVQVLDVRDGQVKIGIKAPEEKGIYRDELYERIRSFNLRAASLDDKDIEDL